MIDELIADMMSENLIISVCSFQDCRKVRIGELWVSATYNPNYKHYSHGLCPECKEKHYNPHLKGSTPDGTGTNFQSYTLPTKG